MDASDLTLGRNRTLVGEALNELRLALIPFVQQQMAATYGPDWRVQAVKILERRQRQRREPVSDDIEHDVKPLLELITADFRPFKGILKSEGRTLVSKLLTVRNQWAHYDFDLSDTFHAYDCVCKLFTRLKYEAPHISAQKASLHSLLAQTAPPLRRDAVAIDREDEEAPTAEPEGIGSDRAATGHENDSPSGGASRTWAAPDATMDSVFSNRDSASRVFNPKKKALIVAGTITGFLAIVGLIQLKNFQGSSRPDVLAESGSPVQTSTSPANSNRHQGPGASSTSPNPSTVQSDPPEPIQPQSPPRREDRSKSTSVLNPTDASRGLSPRPASAQPGASDTTVTPAMPIMKATEHGFTYELESCSASGTTVRCVFAITNQEDDRELMILGSARDRDGTMRDFAALNAGIPGSRVIDDAGNNATMREARLANYDLFGGTLVAGVRTRLVVVFEGISASAQKLSVLDLGSRIDGRGDTFGVQFRQVPLRR